MIKSIKADKSDFSEEFWAKLVEAFGLPPEADGVYIAVMDYTPYPERKPPYEYKVWKGKSQ